MARITADEAGGISVLAFMDTVAWAENTALLAVSEDGYNLLVGSTLAHPLFFRNYAVHPNILREVRPGLKSTAAGRYMFLHRTWLGLVSRLGLMDFGPENQDRGCVELLRQCGALAHIQAGGFSAVDEIARAIACAGAIWASLPGAGYGQPEHKLMDLLTEYGRALARYESIGQALKQVVSEAVH